LALGALSQRLELREIRLALFLAYLDHRLLRGDFLRDLAFLGARVAVVPRRLQRRRDFRKRRAAVALLHYMMNSDGKRCDGYCQEKILPRKVAHLAHNGGSLRMKRGSAL